MAPTPDFDPYPDAETAVYRYTGTSLRLPDGEEGRRVVTADDTVALPDHVADALADTLEAVGEADPDEDEEAVDEAEARGEADADGADTCDTVKSDGEVCGRERPCPYHD